VDDSFLLCFSAHDEAIEFTLPAGEYGTAWQVLIDTMDDDAEPAVVEAGGPISVGPRALVILQRTA
jgi:glycogen operon protein